jgi:energy-coupling factor transport system permease protein
VTSAPGDAASDASLPDFLQRGRLGPYRDLNPLTKAIIATSTSVAAVALGGVVGPLVLVAVAVLVPAVIAGVLPRLLRASLLATLPIAVSAILVNVFFLPGARDVLMQVGPFAATREGLVVAVEVLARILAISGAITLFYLTTPPYELVADLERRGVSSRFAFVAAASVQTVPAMLERASTITDAQRARGLDTEGGPLRRLRALVPLVGPVVLGMTAEVEERTMALEARGFTRPGRRTLLWEPPDSSGERLVRWGLVVAVVVLVGARLTGSIG